MSGASMFLRRGRAVAGLLVISMLLGAPVASSTPKVTATVEALDLRAAPTGARLEIRISGDFSWKAKSSADDLLFIRLEGAVVSPGLSRTATAVGPVDAVEVITVNEGGEPVTLVKIRSPEPLTYVGTTTETGLVFEFAVFPRLKQAEPSTPIAANGPSSAGLAPPSSEGKSGARSARNPASDSLGDSAARRLLAKAARLLDVEDFVVAEEAGPCLNLRAMPSEAGGALDCLSAGALLKVVGLAEGWLRVRIEDGREGWVATDLVRSKLRQDLDDALSDRDRARRDLAITEARAARLAEEAARVREASTHGGSEPAAEDPPPAARLLTAPAEPVRQKAVPQPPLPATLASVERTDSDTSRLEAEVMAIGWAAAWSEQRVEDYLSFYAPAFAPPTGMDRRAWEAHRRRRLLEPSFIRVELKDLRFVPEGPEQAFLRFVQIYRSDSFEDQVNKTLRLVRENGAWRIVSENVG